MDDIVVIDDFLNEDELSHIQDLDSYKNSYWQIQNSNTIQQDGVFDFNTSFLRKNLMDNEYYTFYLFDKIKKFFNVNYKLVDVYLNGQEPLRNGSFHIDNDADRTVILYITPWEPAWGGFTHIMRSDKEHAVIAPLTGRLINFKSNLLHKGYAYCNSNCLIRITVAFKLKL
tara:strand:+ start:43 stop:555 length:513 start_codon:yes stop_codon:yes gene_type:complete